MGGPVLRHPHSTLFTLGVVEPVELGPRRKGGGHRAAVSGACSTSSTPGQQRGQVPDSAAATCCAGAATGFGDAHPAGDGRRLAADQGRRPEHSAVPRLHGRPPQRGYRASVQEAHIRRDLHGLSVRRAVQVSVRRLTLIITLPPMTLVKRIITKMA